MNHPPVPRIPERILEAILAEPDRAFILGDLAEEYQSRIVPHSGNRKARLWYWRQVWQSLRPSLKRRAELRRGKGSGSPGRPKPKGSNIMESWFQDVCYGMRILRRQPLFCTAVALTMALGIGANASI